MFENIQDKMKQKQKYLKEISVKKTEEQFDFFINLFPANHIANFFFDSETLMIQYPLLEKYLNEFLFIESKEFTNDEIIHIQESAKKFCTTLNQLELKERQIIIDILLKKRTEIALSLETHSSRSTINRKKLQAAQSFAIKYLVV